MDRNEVVESWVHQYAAGIYRLHACQGRRITTIHVNWTRGHLLEDFAE